ncbi:hypothetical protein ASPSYDRAFT_782781 [Aspergillus sydowii CBS 593.65]|uniref:Uncharacterized protein n=1 Tax=Aspergillus sydowii CBS 593.65 TaxID=1036612 RepID=A0A1L9TNK1_9EURO|nr:uncharacterized protein ASPSYDRAFT_782781 [Aspergillus sydowii CBS 593.65]OJJ61000.1 hypothetical protein ASPSYDRAFT_782781 [Aspergillus sydowii CBS 593.65]
MATIGPSANKSTVASHWFCSTTPRSSSSQALHRRPYLTRLDPKVPRSTRLDDLNRLSTVETQRGQGFGTFLDDSPTLATHGDQAAQPPRFHDSCCISRIPTGLNRVGPNHTTRTVLQTNTSLLWQHQGLGSQRGAKSIEGQSQPSTNELILPRPENQRHKARRHARQLLPLLFGWSGPGFKVAGMIPESLSENPTKNSYPSLIGRARYGAPRDKWSPALLAPD